VFQTDKHVTRDETKVIYKILFTDYTNSFALKTIVSAEKAHLIDDTLKPGKTILTSGKVMLDTFEKELLLRPDSIALVKRTYRQDTSEKKRVELHLHTNMSSMDGMTPADKLVQRAAYFGHTAVAITDHGVAQAYPDAMNAQKAVEKSGKEMKILYGVEGYLVNDMVPAVVGKSKEVFDGEFIIFDLETTGLLLALLVTQIVAFPSALIFGRLSAKYPSSQLIPVCIAAYTGIAVFAFFLTSQWQFWVLAVLVGMFQGGVQALSRSHFAKIIPAEKSGEYFGLFDICGKGASFLGTMIVSVGSQLTGSANVGIGMLALLFAVGFVLFRVSCRTEGAKQV